MNKIVFRFLLQLFSSIIIVFIVHTFLLNLLGLPVFENKIILAYIVNTILAIMIFLFLFFFRQKYKDQLGFLYLGGSLFKFAIFFMLFYPVYGKDNSFTTLEFAAFFIPYLTCLFIETLSLIKLLNSPEQNQ